jgi:hypothetical protein
VFALVGIPGRSHAGSISSVNDASFPEVDTSPTQPVESLRPSETLTSNHALAADTFFEDTVIAAAVLSSEIVPTPVTVTTGAASLDVEPPASSTCTTEDEIPPRALSLAGVWEFCAKLEKV